MLASLLLTCALRLPWVQGSAVRERPPCCNIRGGRQASAAYRPKGFTCCHPVAGIKRPFVSHASYDGNTSARGRPLKSRQRGRGGL